jgi:hypothetical protein
MAEAALGGDPAVLADLASKLVVPERNNFVERPWGGTRIREFKRYHPLPDQPRTTGYGLGEAFEISAFAADAEAARHPSAVRLADGSTVSLEALLACRGGEVLGAAFVARFGHCFPLLPKTLDVAELLSVQGHPPGHTEVYIVIDAEPGATLRVGFNRDVNARELGADLVQGLRTQRRLLEALRPDLDEQRLQRAVQPWLAEREAGPDEARAAVIDGAGTHAASAPVLALAADLKALYWRVLDALNPIALAPGRIIHNATPARHLGPGIAPSAEVHALGNPEGREALVLEIRRPGPTFRAWDNVRFPMREVDVEAALAALNLRATTPGDFVVERRDVPGRPGVSVSVVSDAFRIEHLEPAPQRDVRVPGEQPHSLHVLAGETAVFDRAGREIGRLARGESALVPVGVGDYSVTSGHGAHVVKVALPRAG